ncbi:MAG: DUF4292 domain-containing protein [Prevotella sp.]|nr:DUF4292 domain-containing protein [Prevotella sp.]
MKKLHITMATMGLAMLLASCASKKAVVDNTPTQTQATTPTQTGTQTPSTRSTDAAATQAAVYLKKVLDNQVYAKNVVGDMTFNITMGSKDVTVPGSVHMRRDEVIRLQLFIPLLGTEVGRVEFSPGRVLIVDRMHKEYIEADYNQLDFLKNNGLNFYSLQALFWNELLVPGQKSVGEGDFPKFSVSGTNVKLTNGNMTYNWTTSAKGQIVMTNVNYASAKSGASSLLWMYSDFKTLGTKQFPAHQNFQFSTSSSNQLKTVKVNIDMNEVKDKSDWDAKTVVSNKYKKVEPTDILGKLLKF